MPKLDIQDVTLYVQQNIGTFHAKRLEKLQELDFDKVLQRKNPYLFKAKGILTAQDLVSNVLNAYLQSQEETLFGDFLEGLAIFICHKVFHGKKSDLEGIDLEFAFDKVYYIVEIKSGPNWGNSSQIKKMRENFNKAKVALSAQFPDLEIKAVNGCCYGRQHQVTDDYEKICGQRFWQLISGSDTLYTEIIEPLGHQTQERNNEFLVEYAKVVNIFTLTFAQNYCDRGEINWQKIVALTSQHTKS